jgi:hypothetical protein
MKKLKLASCIFIVGIFMLGLSNQVQADRQADLKAKFDIVETFDNIADWHGGVWGEAGGGNSTINPNDLPQHSSGGVAQWGYSTTTTGGWTATDPEWIGSRPLNETWAGKNLIINYTNGTGDCNADDGLGPSRLGIFVGDNISSTSGYHELHAFYMMKFPQGFFKRKPDNSGYEYHDYNKFLQVSAGFTGIHHWGTNDENQTSCAINSRIAEDYGTTYNLFNLIAGGASYPGMHLLESGRIPGYDSAGTALSGATGCWQYTLYRNNNHLTGADFKTPYEANEWFGIEYILNQGTVGNADGSVRVKIYNKSGVLISEETQTNLQMLAHFDHRFNKVVMGGNLSISAPACSDENRVYIDDFIIDNNEVAPTYFATINGVAPTDLCKDQTTLTGLTTCLKSHMPANASEGFIVPTTQNLVDFASLSTSVFGGTCNDTIVPAGLSSIYTVWPMDKYCVISEKQMLNGWGTLIINTIPSKQISIQAPHPKYDTNTLEQAAAIFEEIEAHTLVIAGAHRNSNAIDGCQSGYKISDVSHNVDNFFHVVTEEIINNTSDTVIQFHGMSASSCSGVDVYITHGVSTIPVVTDKATKIRNAFRALDGSVTINIPGDAPTCSLNATKNTVGRFINDSANACTTSATNYNGRFIHIEQKIALRNSAQYANWSEAIRRAYSVTRADVDQNSSINSTDALLTLRNSLGLEMSGTNWQASSTTGEVNCDSISNSTDALLILRESLGLEMSGTGWCVG